MYGSQLSVLLSEDIQTFANDALQLQLGTAHKLGKGKILWSNLVDAKGLLTV